jgi:hypothetical protein
LVSAEDGRAGVSNHVLECAGWCQSREVIFDEMATAYAYTYAFALVLRLLLTH